ncbi:Phosphatidylinositol 45-bisphosphate 5-phosphatase A [Dissostichus eleginoides]|uniref:Phosphatidylinositol 45-bisphosphate 5-phosphatase A n=1 Tax=Dissostichus eleginoides TaxID=100907 RepID=A0AAD9CR14_DISEL|nr:Phosphatidylinositol 45-bisphosphate 5-phosphatase A [Dissostichus eleginoides]
MEAEVWSVPHARPYPTTPPRQKLAAVFPRVHEENCVYVAAMRLDSLEPNTEPGHRDRAGECEEFSQHICSLLCTFSPLWDVKSAARPEDATTLLHSEGGREAAMSGGSRQFG